MNDDFNSIFDNTSDDNTATDETVNETVNEIAENVDEAVDNDETESVSEPSTETSAKEPTTVPIAALLDTRDKLKDEKRRADEAEQRLAQYENAQRNQQQTSFPDPYDDPDAYRVAITKEIEDRFVATRMNDSRADAIEKHGEELTQKSIDWAVERVNSDPTFEAKAIAQRNPVEWIIQEHKRHAELSDFQTDREAFIRREAAKLGIGTTELSQVSQTTTPNGVKNTAPRSLATVPSATKNGTTDIDHTELFNSIFDKKR